MLWPLKCEALKGMPGDSGGLILPESWNARHILPFQVFEVTFLAVSGDRPTRFRRPLVLGCGSPPLERGDCVAEEADY